MEDKELFEGNKLIAEFMGCYQSIHWCGSEELNYWGFKDTHITDRWHESKFNWITPYHESWDWLMPVKEKIDSIDNNEYDVIIWRSDCHINDRVQILVEASIFKAENTLIQIVWKCFVEFIKWYNQNQPHDKR